MGTSRLQPQHGSNMTMEEIVAKYQARIAELTGVKPEEVVFRASDGLVLKFEPLTASRPYGKPAGEDFLIGRYIVMVKGDDYPIAGFNLYELPHCCGVMVSTSAYVSFKWRKRGIGQVLNAMRQDLGRFYGYTVMLCTDVVTNDPQRHILQKAGFQDLMQFENKRTGHQVAISAISL
jgi:hypothetical protein